MNAAEHPEMCHWLSPTWLMPHPASLKEASRPWSCLRDGYPRPLSANEFEQCAECARWEPRTFDAVKRDLIFEAWGTGELPTPNRSFDEAKHDLVLEAWGVE